GQKTINEVTQHNFNTSLEFYGQYGAIGKQGFLYADVKTGFQAVQTSFAQGLGVPHDNVALTQIAGGVQFADYMRIGFERFFGPAPAFGVTAAELSGWHLV